MGTLSYMPPEAIAGSSTSVHDGKEIYKLNFTNIFAFIELVVGKNLKISTSITKTGRYLAARIYKDRNDYHEMESKI